jgi:hypothetical protein
MIALNYVVKKALVSYYQGDKRNTDYQTYKGDWPKLSRDRRKKIKQRYWYPICEIAGPEFDLWLGDKQ